MNCYAVVQGMARSSLFRKMLRCDLFFFSEVGWFYVAVTSVYSSRKPCFYMLFFSILDRIFQFCGGKCQVKMNELSLVFCCNMTKAMKVIVGSQC